MKNFITILLALLIFLVSALFFAQNDDLVVINYFSGKLEWQLNWVMVACLLLGFLIGILSILGSLMSTKLQLRNARAKLKRQEKELNSLRALPTKEDF